jgi:UDP-GlcNAc:undecaprenyl-phosphate GlcNAc-1-phosphate transferase
VVNAFNFIDGANGLLLLTFISILTSLRLMVYIPEEHYFKNIIDVLISICLIQLIFNYPIAKIFAGDLGAYSFGFIIACLVISIFGIYPQYLTWQAIMVLFYPILEIIFTMTRRLLNNKSPFEADRYHLHQLIFTYFCKYFKTYLSNSLTTATLIPIFIFSPIWIYLNNVNLDLYSIILGLFLNLLMYLTYYIFFSRLVNAK